MERRSQGAARRGARGASRAGAHFSGQTPARCCREWRAPSRGRARHYGTGRESPRGTDGWATRVRMTEASLYPVIPYLHVQQHDWEVTSMSDYAHSGRRSKTLAEHRTVEYRLMFGACYFLSLASAIVGRLTPW